MTESRSPAGHRYLPTGTTDREEMLRVIGAESIEDLFSALPREILSSSPPAIAGPLSDQGLREYFGEFDRQNRVAGRDLACFLGGGAYRHEIPSVIDSVLTRSEFLTVYTPYQPEVSQGTLQSIFEFQTFIALLTGLDVANASLYEGASAFAEGALMATRIQRRRRKVVVARSIHPHYRETLATYVQNLDIEVVEVGWGPDGSLDLAALEGELGDDVACVAVQSPNYFGVVESWEAVSSLAKGCGALTLGVVTEALSLALLKSPGEGGCDIAVGDAHSFGLPLSFGGPYLGFMATRDRHKRAMPGRLTGSTVDSVGERAFVLTLATREQHIRREKATSNICTNQALCALAATVYLSLHGKKGLHQLAQLNAQRAGSLRRRIEGLEGFESAFASPCFNEFAVRARGSVQALLKGLEEDGVLAGVPLGEDYPELEDCFLVTATECNSPQELHRLVELLGRRAVTDDTLPITL